MTHLRLRGQGLGSPLTQSQCSSQGEGVLRQGGSAAKSTPEGAGSEGSVLTTPHRGASSSLEDCVSSLCRRPGQPDTIHHVLNLTSVFENRKSEGQPFSSTGSEGTVAHVPGLSGLRVGRAGFRAEQHLSLQPLGKSWQKDHPMGQRWACCSRLVTATLVGRLCGGPSGWTTMADAPRLPQGGPGVAGIGACVPIV